VRARSCLNTFSQESASADTWSGLSLSIAKPAWAPFWLWQPTQYVWSVAGRLGEVPGACANASARHVMDTASMRFTTERRGKRDLVPGKNTSAE
jgi:hypothetical protein